MGNVLDDLKSEVSNNGNGLFSGRKPNNKILRLGRKYPETVRIIPYPDRAFWYPYRTLWVDLYNQDHSETFSAPLIFSYKDNGDDKLRTLVGKITKYNFQYRKDTKNDKTVSDFTGDKIPIQFPNPKGYNYNSTLRPMFALQAIKVVLDPNGTPVEKTYPSSNLPLAQIMNVPKTVMRSITSSITSGDMNVLVSYADKDTGKPFPLNTNSFTQFRWINIGKSFPIYIHLDDSNRYKVDPHNLQPLPPLPKSLYDKDSKGKYKYLDDPAWLYEPTKTQAPRLWKLAYQQLKARWDKEQNANGGKSYAQPTVDQAKNVKKNIEQETAKESKVPNGKDNSASSQSNPYDTPKQSSSANSNNDNPVSDPFSANSNASSTSASSNESNSASSSSSTVPVHSSSSKSSKSIGSKNSVASNSSSSNSNSSSDNVDAIIKDALKG